MKRIILALILALALCAAAGLALGETAADRSFGEAMNALADGRYSEAADLFDALGAYPSASRWALYAKALMRADQAQYAAADAMLTLLGDFEDSAMRRQDIAARSLERSENYEKALQIYRAYPGYLDFDARADAVPGKINDRDYRRADAAENAGRLQEAFEGFTALIPYKDSRDRAAAVYGKICAKAYAAADAMERNNQLREAMEAFRALVPYSDSADRADAIDAKIKSTAYAHADALEKSGDLHEAYEAFLALVPYSDSADRAADLHDAALYELGMDQVADRNYSAAYATFTSLGSYRDSAVWAYTLSVTTFAAQTQYLADGVFAYQYRNVWGLSNTGAGTVGSARWEEIRPLDHGVAVVLEKGKYGLLSDTADVIVPPVYDRIEGFDALGLSRVKRENLFGLMNPAGDLILPVEYTSVGAFDSHRLAVVQKAAKYGLVDPEGVFVLPLEYDAITPFDSFGLARITAEGKTGLVGTDGTVILAPAYDSIGEFDRCGLAQVKSDSLYGLIDTKGAEVAGVLYSAIDAFTDVNGITLARASRDDLWGYLSVSGEEVIPCEWAAISGFRDGVCTVAAQADGKVLFGLRGPDNNEILPAQWRILGGSAPKSKGKSKSGYVIAAPDFDGGFMLGCNDEERWGLLNARGEILGGRTWDEIGTFVNGIAPVRMGTLWGFFRLDGTVLAEPAWIAYHGFSEGMAAVRADTLWGYLDMDGNLSIDMQYSDVTDFVNRSAHVYVPGEGWNVISASGTKWYDLSETYLKAEALLAEGRWLEAAELYETIPDDASAVVRAHQARYTLAVEQLEAGQLEEARENFRLAGDYRDAPAMMDKPGYMMAQALLDAGDREGARLLFAESAAYGDAREQAWRIDYEDAQSMLAQDDLDGAIAALTRCAPYADASARLHDAWMRKGRLALAEKNWDGAVRAYRMAGDGEDVWPAIQEARLAQSDALMEAGDFDGALAILDALEKGDDMLPAEETEDEAPVSTEEAPDTTGARIERQKPVARIAFAGGKGHILRAESGADDELARRRRQILDAKAAALIEAGNWDGAEEVYLAANDRAAALDVRMHHTDALKAADQWEEAMLVLDASVTAYPEAKDNLSAARKDLYTEWGKSLENAGDYAGAGHVYETAAQAFPKAGFSGMRDAAEYSRASLLMEEGSYADAEEALRSLGDYSDSAALADSCVWLEALSDKEKGQYTDALALLARIPDYDGAADQITECNYLQAAVLKDNGQGDEALAIYRTMMDYRDVRQIVASDPAVSEAMNRWRASLAPGDTVTLGHQKDQPLTWVILDRDERGILLLAEDYAEQRIFDESRDSEYKHYTWQLSGLRTYLNGVFIRNTFNSRETAGILKTKVLAEWTPDSLVSPGNHTTDRIFILSRSEVNRYRAILKQHPHRPNDPKATEYWWTRSPGTKSGQLLIIKKGPDMRDMVFAYNKRVWVRPAMWVDPGIITQ